MADFDDDFDEVAVALRSKISAALRSGGRTLLDASNALVPIDSGELRASGKVTVEGTEATVSYDTPYAIRQHESPKMTHRNGQMKFLEIALLANQSAIEQAIADDLRF